MSKIWDGDDLPAGPPVEYIGHFPTKTYWRSFGRNLPDHLLEMSQTEEGFDEIARSLFDPKALAKRFPELEELQRIWTREAWLDGYTGAEIGDGARLSRRGAVTSLGPSGPSRERAGVRRVHIADGAPCAQAPESAGPEVSPVRLRPIFGCQTSAVADPSLAKVTSRTRTAAASRTTVSVSAAVGTRTNRHRRADAWKTSVFT